MNALFYIANGLVLPPAMHFAWNFYRYKGSEIEFRKLWISIAILSVTVIVTSLQFIFPEIISVLSRDREAILSGELWRSITPIFIQPMGVWQCFFNGLFFISFMPIAEHLYGRSVLLIYFGVSMIGQIIILYWETTPGGLSTAGGGSSTALYAVMGALFTYIVVHREVFPKGYIFLSIAGFIGAIILLFFEDGHAPVVLLGGIFGFFLRRNARQITAYSQSK